MIPPGYPITYVGQDLHFEYRGHKPNTIDRWKDLWDKCDGDVGIDTETPSLEDRTILCVGVSTTPGESYYFRKDSPVLPWHLFEQPGVCKVFYNVGFDGALIEDQGHVSMVNYIDAMLGLGLLGLIGTLAYMSKLLFDHDMFSVEDLIGPKGVNQKRMDEISESKVRDKVLQDCEETLAVWWAIKEVVPKAAFDLDTRFIPLANEMEKRGILVNQERLAEHKVRVEKQVLFYRNIAKAYGFNPGSSLQLAAVLESRGWYVRRKKLTGKPILDEDTLRADYSDDPIAHLALLYRKSNVLLTTYITKTQDIHIKDDLRIHPHFNLGVASTGRITHTKPNCANYPEAMRDIFIPREGTYALAQDLSQIELRVLGYLVLMFTGDHTMMDIMESGADIHQEVANMVGCTRRVAKNINFAVAYGGDENTLLAKDGIPLLQGSYYIDLFYQRFPGIRVLKAQTNDMLYSKGYVETLMGRRRGFWYKLASGQEYQYRAAEREAFNLRIQGTAAEILKEWQLRLWDENQINSIHDEFWDEHEIGRPIRTDSNLDLMPFTTPAAIKIGKNFAPAEQGGQLVNTEGLVEVMKV